MDLEVQPQQGHFAIYTLIYVMGLLSDAPCHRTERPSSASPFDKLWGQGDKNLNFQTFQWIGENLEMQYRLFKNSTLWIGKNLEKYTAPDQHFKIPILSIWMSWENLCSNLSFTVENKMENSHKRGWSHFKLKINDWDISFPKILRICQWIGKNIFHWGKWNEPIKLIRECNKEKIFDLLPLVQPCSFYMQDA